MKNALLVTTAMLSLATACPAYTQAATLTYNVNDGGLTLDGSTTPQGITGYSLELDPGSGLSFNTGAFTSALDDGLIPDEIFDSVLAEQVNLGATGLAGSASIGPVLPAGLTLVELDSALSNRSYSSGLAAGGNFDLVVVPEPGAAGLLLVGAAMVLRRRRTMR